ncbi:MAG: RecQ family ATP-dependent DNA helicase [Sphaerochaetaceae bacterium]|nr:RecQ family ATP-dependent DNA helicase [Sphaerochaetaceae bacterium]
MNYLYELTRTASGKFGIKNLKPYQILVIHKILENEFEGKKSSQIVILPTGTGKSLCFLIPSVICSGISIIVYPLLALMNDQLKRLKNASVDCVCLRGGQSREERKRIFRKIEEGCKVIVTNPETLKSKGIIEFLKKFKVSLFTVDEAHTIVSWGEEFRPAFLELGKVAVELGASQVLAFTATADRKTIERIREVLLIDGADEIAGSLVEADSDRENVFYSVYPAYSREEGLLRLVKSLGKEDFPALVFCRERLETGKLCQLVLRNVRGIKASYYHAGLTKAERERIEAWFLKSTDGILFATCAYGMGVDKSNIRTVIHYRLPATVSEYLQESGRAGRDGRWAQARVIVTEKEKLESKNELVKIFSSDGCRRSALLRGLGQKKEECSGCDWCSASVITKPLIAPVALRMIGRRPFVLDPSMAAAILCADRDVNILSKPGRTDPYWGLEKENDQDLVEKVFLNMPELGRVDSGPFIRLFDRRKPILRFVSNIMKLTLKVKGLLLRYRYAFRKIFTG